MYISMHAHWHAGYGCMIVSMRVCVYGSGYFNLALSESVHICHICIALYTDMYMPAEDSEWIAALLPLIAASFAVTRYCPHMRELERCQFTLPLWLRWLSKRQINLHKHVSVHPLFVASCLVGLLEPSLFTMQYSRQ